VKKLEKHQLSGSESLCPTSKEDLWKLSPNFFEVRRELVKSNSWVTVTIYFFCAIIVSGYVMESVIEKLRQVGFTEYKAKAYLAQKW
jgi:hypothetical protein